MKPRGVTDRLLRAAVGTITRHDRFRCRAASLVEALGRELGRAENANYDKIYEQFKEFTRIPRPAFKANLKLVDRFRHVEGCVVECGVWRGGMSAGIASLLGPKRCYFLYDSFEGLPAARGIDGRSAAEWQEQNNVDNCRTEKEYAIEAMRLAGVTDPYVVPGWFENTLPQFPPNNRIAILRLDADWYSSTAECLNHLYGQVAEGGVVILDDYFTWDGCSRALHAFLAANISNERIREEWPRIAYIVKLKGEASVQINPHPEFDQVAG